MTHPYIHQQELIDALIRIDVPPHEAAQIAEDAFAQENKLGIAMLWGIRKFGNKASTSVTEFKTCSRINNLNMFKTAAKLAAES